MGVLQPTFPENSCLTFRCAENLKSVPRLKLQDKLIGLLHRKTWDVYQSAMPCPVSGNLPRIISDFYSPLGPMNVSPPSHQSQMIKKHLLCGVHLPVWSSFTLER